MTIEEMEQTRGVLLKMKEDLVAGWVQKELWNKNGVCVLGALVRAADLPPHTETIGLFKTETFYNTDDNPAANEAAYLLDQLAGGNIVRWNDRPGRTQGEVVALVDDALAKLAADNGVGAFELAEREVV